MDIAQSEDGVAAFLAQRPRLFGIAYRILGTSSEAEDVVQDAWLRWQTANRDEVREPAAFLTTTVTRLAINVLQSARKQREEYIGPWLPEPVDTSQDPYLGAERGEALDLAVLLLMEKLSPTERAAYVLREAFDYSYGQIATLLDTSDANCRQLVTRARKHLATERHASVDLDHQQRLFESFLAAAQLGDMASLEKLFAADIVSLADGGGVVTAARVPLIGRERVAKVVSAFASHFWIGATMRWVQANGTSALLIDRKGSPIALVSIDTSEDGIERMYWMMHPEKIAKIFSATLSQASLSPVKADRGECL